MIWRTIFVFAFVCFIAGIWLALYPPSPLTTVVNDEIFVVELKQSDLGSISTGPYPAFIKITNTSDRDRRILGVHRH